MIKPGTLCMVRVPQNTPYSDVSGSVVVAVVKLTLMAGIEAWQISPPLFSKDEPGQPLDWAKEAVLFPFEDFDPEELNVTDKELENV